MQQFSAFFVTNWPLFLALAIIIAMLARSFFGAGASKAVRPAEALQLINHKDALVLDVRTDKEYQEGHVLNSMHVPLGMLSNQLSRLAAYKQTPIVVVCRSGARSGQAVGTLSKAGFEEVYNLAGGVMAWQSANMPLSKDKGKPPKPVKHKPAAAADDSTKAEDGKDEVKALEQTAEADATFEEAAPQEETTPRIEPVEQTEEAPEQDVTNSPEIVIYTGGMCPYCARAIQLLKKKGVAYTELSVDGKPELRQEMIQKANGATSVPQIFVDGKHIGDCDGIHALDAQGKLDALLGITES